GPLRDGAPHRHASRSVAHPYAAPAPRVAVQAAFASVGRRTRCRAVPGKRIRVSRALRLHRSAGGGDLHGVPCPERQRTDRTRCRDCRRHGSAVMVRKTCPMPTERLSSQLPRDFRLYLVSRFCTGTAMTMLRAAISWHVFALTGSAFHLALVGLVQFIPAVALS